MKNRVMKQKSFHFIILFVFINANIVANIINCNDIRKDSNKFNENASSTLDMIIRDSEFSVNGIISSEVTYGKTSNKTVIGFLPYWEDINQNWDPLTYVAWFGIELNPDGTINAYHGWPETTLISDVHAEGKKIILTATMFDNVDIHTMLSTPTYANATINNLLTQVENGNADGICIDFEFPQASDKTYLVNFMNQLNSTFKEANNDYHISLCTPAIDWSGAFDYDQLEPHIDSFILMGEGYYYSGSSNAGPTSPLYGGSYNLNWSVNDHITWGAPAEKIILRLPFYGRDYPVVDETKQSLTRDLGVAITYNDSLYKIASNNSISINYDPTFECEWYNYWEDGDGWHQVWCDNEESLIAKMDYIIDNSLAGLGIWAWGYQDDHEELEEMIYYKFHEDTTVPTIEIVKPIDGAKLNSSSVQLEWQGTDNIAIGSYSISWNNGDTWEILNLLTTKIFILTDGTYQAIIRVNDTSDNTAYDTISFTINTKPDLFMIHLIGITVLVIGVLIVSNLIHKKREKSKNRLDLPPDKTTTQKNKKLNKKMN